MFPLDKRMCEGWGGQGRWASCDVHLGVMEACTPELF